MQNFPLTKNNPIVNSDVNVTSAKIADCAKKSKTGKDYCETAAKSAKC